MLDFEKIREMSYLIFELDQMVIFDNGIIINRQNFTQVIQSIYDT